MSILCKDEAKFNVALRSINHAELSVVFASNDHLAHLLKHSAQFPCLKLIIAMNELPAESKRILTAWGQEKGIQVMEILEGRQYSVFPSIFIPHYATSVEEFGKANPVPPPVVTSDTVVTICFTSVSHLK